MRLTALLFVGTFLLSGCENFLAVDDPDIVQPGDLSGEAGLTALRLGALGDFAVAYSGSASEPGQVLHSGLLADEFISTAFAERAKIDSRRIPIAESVFDILVNPYRNLHRARRAAESAAEEWSNADAVSGVSTALAQLHGLAGYTYVFFAETYCSGVPFSRITETGDVEYGNGSTTTEMLDIAIAHFDEAITEALAAGDTELGYLSQVGKARALVNKGMLQEAAQIVMEVPTEWEYSVKHSTATDRQVNGIVEFSNVNERFSVANREGGGIDFRDAFEAGDPRTPWRVAPDSAAANADLVGYHQLKYSGRDAPVVLASGIEGRLIEAEEALQGGDVSRFEVLHNNLRARLNTSVVGPVDVDTMSQDEMVAFHFRERALWLWLTGHRLGDLRRLVRQYGRNQDEVFPSGDYFRPDIGTYGEDVVFPLPMEELNNPNVEGIGNLCINRDA